MIETSATVRGRARRRRGRVAWLASSALIACWACSVDDRSVDVLESPAPGGSAGTEGGSSAGGRDEQDDDPPVASGTADPEGEVSDPSLPRDVDVLRGDCDPANQPGRCADAATSQPCDESGQWGDAVACSGATPVCRADLDGTCGCVETQRRCVAGAPELCTSGAWRGTPACEAPLGHCLPRTGECVSCEPDTETCQGGLALRCDANGEWQGLESCAGRQVSCGQCAPGEPCTTNEDCAVGLCLTGVGACGCDPDSCTAPLECSLVTGLCEEPGSDCPTPAPVPFGETDLAVVRVRFDPSGSAQVVLRNVAAGLISFAPLGYLLCNGANNCVYLSEDVPITVLIGDEFTVTIPNTAAAGGELAVVFELDGVVTSETYLAWGSGGGDDSLELRANDPIQFWSIGDRIDIAPGDDGFVCTGLTGEAAGYTSCNP